MDEDVSLVEGKKVQSKTPLSEWLSNTSSVDLEAIKSAVNSSKNNQKSSIANAFRTGVDYDIGLGNIYSHGGISANLGNLPNMRAEANIGYKDDTLDFLAGISREDIDEINDKLLIKKLAAGYSDNGLELRGEYKNLKLPFDEEDTQTRVYGKYELAPKWSLEGDYSDSKLNGHTKGFGLGHILPNDGKIRIGYDKDSKGRGNTNLQFAWRN